LKSIAENGASLRERFDVRAANADELVGNLSGGNQQKVVLAKWLARDCDVLIFDEPTRGIDVGSKAQIYQLINDLACGDPTTGRKPVAVLMAARLKGRVDLQCRQIPHGNRPDMPTFVPTLWADCVGTSTDGLGQTIS
jgi:ABC-type arginine transport system ATPase subunit